MSPGIIRDKTKNNMKLNELNRSEKITVSTLITSDLNTKAQCEDCRETLTAGQLLERGVPGDEELNDEGGYGNGPWLLGVMSGAYGFNAVNG